MRRAAAIAALALAASAPPAAASTASVVPLGGSPGVMQLRYDADPGETNDVTVTGLPGAIDITDPGATITAGSGCTSVDPSHVVCTSIGVGQLFVGLADGDDHLTVADSAYPPPSGDVTRPDVDVAGGDGDDVIRTGAGLDNLLGGLGDDDISAGAGNDFVGSLIIEPPDGSPGPDGDDTLDGGPGDDGVIGGPGRDVVTGGEGADFVDGGSGDDTVSGGLGDDPSVIGGPGQDVADGGPGNDTVDGGPGDDAVRGGDGDDQLEATDGKFPFADASGRLLSLYGLGRDTVEGGPGDDVMHAGLDDRQSPDGYDGGPGVDTVSYAQRTTPVSVTLAGGAEDGAAGEQDLVGPEVERVIGGRDSDSLIGASADETLDGGPADDLLDGGSGNDTLEGGINDGGSDTLSGGPGLDTLRGGAGDDSLDGGADADTLLGGGGSDALAGAGGADALSGGPGIDAVAGGDGDDVLRGGDVVLVGADGADALDGGPGFDQLLGGPGNDTLDGGPGPDRLEGNEGRDTVTYEARNADVQVSFNGIADDGESGERDNVVADVEGVVGSAVDDTLAGDARANALDGSSGEDYVDGASGPDVLGGGTARDAIRARDGTADVVACGDDVDFAILDRLDTARDCEYVDRGTPRRAVLGRDAAVRPQGRIAIRLPGTRRRIPLADDVHVPLGTTLDASRGRLRLTAARNAAGRPMAMTFYDGAFTVRQRLRTRPVTVLRMRGGSFAACPPSGAASSSRPAARAAAKRTVRRLWGRGSRLRGRFRVEGRWSTGTVRGTVWLTADRCDGTLTRVVTGSVTVRDRVRRRTVVVRAGHSYLAKAPAPGR